MVVGVLCLLLIIAVALCLVWILRDDEKPLTEAELRTETIFQDENGAPQTFPKLVDGTGVAKHELYLSVVIPAYNERERLPGMLDEAIATFESRQKTDPKFTWEIIIVDDGSRDNIQEVTAPYVKKSSSAHVRLMQLARNQGKGAAVTKGALVARGALIYMADADLAAKASELTKLEEKIKTVERDEYGIAVGSRAHLQEDESVAKRKWYRIVLMHAFHALVYFVGGVRNIQDTQCGYKLFTRKAAAAIFSSIHVRRWAFDVEVLRIAQYLKLPVVEVPINWHEVDGSKLNLKGMITMAKDLFRIRIMFFTSQWEPPSLV